MSWESLGWDFLDALKYGEGTNGQGIFGEITRDGISRQAGFRQDI
jgi:hypothetical protein